MALIRCREHPPSDEYTEWPAAVEPVGYPDTAILCGHRAHLSDEPGLVYLTPAEYRSYQRGRRAFGVVGASARVAVSETVYVDDEPRLPRPSAPARDELAIDVSGVDDLDDAEARGLRLGIQSYLWSDHWRDSLAAQGMTWPEFLSATAELDETIQAWAIGEAPWSAVLEAFVDVLEVGFRDPSL